MKISEKTENAMILMKKYVKLVVIAALCLTSLVAGCGGEKKAEPGKADTS